MRTEQEMMDLLLGVAAGDERIRAVTLEGSRTNPNAPKDMFQDYDIGYHVTDMESFRQHPGWTDVFGDKLIGQMPEAMSMFPPELGRRFSYLMLFADGNRIDLTLIPVDEADRYAGEDKLMRVLLDKDRLFPQLLPPTDEDYWVKRPTPAFYADCCNEFWWVSTYVAKGLWRKELLFALDHLHLYVRPMLIKMLEWQVGTETNFSVSIGKNAKYLQRWLSGESWEELLSTYPNGTYQSAWNALSATGDMFRKHANIVARRLGFAYPLEDDRRVTAYLLRVRSTAPRDSGPSPPD